MLKKIYNCSAQKREKGRKKTVEFQIPKRKKKMEKIDHLKWREILLDKIVERKIIICKLLANFTLFNTTPDILPIFTILHSVLKPIAIIPQFILFVASSRHQISRAFIGHKEGEYREAQDGDDEEEHHEKVQPQQQRHVATGTDESGEGY